MKQVTKKLEYIFPEELIQKVNQVGEGFSDPEGDFILESHVVSENGIEIVSSKNLQTLPKYSAAEISYCLNLVESGDYVYLDTTTQSKCEVVVTHYRANEAVYLDVIWITSLIAISILYVAVRAFYKVYNNYF